MPFGSVLGGDDFDAPYGAIAPGDTRTFAEQIKGAVFSLPRPQYDELVAAAGEETRLTRLTSSRDAALADAVDNRIKTVQQQTGVQLENPFRGGYIVDAQRRYVQARNRGEDLAPPSVAVRQFQRDIFNEKVDDLATAHPDKAAALSFYQSLDSQAGAIASNAEERAALARRNFAAAGGSGIDEFIGEIAGGLRGSWRDPLTIGSLAFAPFTGGGSTIFARVASTAMIQGAINVGLLALEKPAANAWRRERGLADQGNLPSLSETGLAFALGAIPGAAIESVIEAKALGSLRRVMAGNASGADIAPAMRALGVPADDATIDMLRAGLRETNADAAALAETPAGAPPPLAADANAQALRHALDLDGQPPPPQLPLVADGVTDAAAVAALDSAPDRLAGIAALRDSRALVESALSSPRPDVQAAGRLATLSDEAFAMLGRGADPLHALATAEMTPRPEWHADVLQTLAEARPADAAAARKLAADTVEILGGRAATTREGLRQTLAAEDAAVLDNVSAGVLRTTPAAGEPLAALIARLPAEAQMDIALMAERAPEAARASALRYLRRSGEDYSLPVSVAERERQAARELKSALAEGRAEKKAPDRTRGAAVLDNVSAGAVRQQRPEGGNRLRGIEKHPEGYYTLPIRNERDARIGAIAFTIDDQAVTVRASGIEDPAQAGKGHALWSYQRLADWALDSGRQLWSDASVTPQASRVYDALERRGYTVERDLAASHGNGQYNAQGPGALKVTAKPAEAVVDSGPAAKPAQRPPQSQSGPSESAVKVDPDDPANRAILPSPDGSAELVGRDGLAAIGERDELFADLIRACH